MLGNFDSGSGVVGREEIGTVLISGSLNIGADLGINGHFPEYDFI